ncbi:LOW QUALITY PROTEIN: uncharacterized protein EMH_0001870 [Eimeria mitis]|uniref:DNA-directed RNA polymerase n=1 Tax=Eimeria mitis TaxID=44415 RepID=U6JT81_9EIME|nr:LOW QUALITY PROTEIN: uncharacterized protein EMH_0001870 [Eimeria mitis]CDJ28629.1 hypothetical protein EMH_0001870 [Eimeria mitis]
MPSRNSVPIDDLLQQHEAQQQQQQQQQQGGTTTTSSASTSSSSEKRSLLMRHLMQQETRMKSERPSFLLKGNEIYLGWGPRAKACQDFRVYDTSTVRSAVSLLGSVPWQINKELLHVLQAAWAAGESLGKMPSRNSVPIDDLLQQHEAQQQQQQQQQQGGTTTTSSASTSSSSEKRSLLMRHLMQQETRMKSERPSFLLKLETAENFAVSSALYFPHNIDFRGRCYPLPPHLNHMGDDVSRALLRFARSKPLGDSGWRWLRIHLANLFGHNKVSFEDRRRWTDTRMEQILAAAEEPLQHKQFWGAADEPWQALAAILEIAAAVRSGDPPAFYSKLPVHLDGTCNGLQHYAALNRDLRGGAAVNLVPAETPQDVYSLVLQVVKQNVHRVASGCTDTSEAAAAAAGGAASAADSVEAEVGQKQQGRGRKRKQQHAGSAAQQQRQQRQQPQLQESSSTLVLLLSSSGSSVNSRSCRNGGVSLLVYA